MRLFIGINLDDNLKETVADYRPPGSSKLVPPRNYHITLVYLGDTTPAKKETLHQALESLSHALVPCRITLPNTNSFKKGRTYIATVDVEKTDCLTTMQTKIKSLVESLGYTVDARPYHPHITLAKKVEDKPAIRRVNQSFTVKAITLFLSHRVNGDLTYTPIETYPLK